MNKIQKNEEALKIAEEKLKNAPEGMLRVRKVAGTCRYYHERNGKSRQETYLGTADAQEIKELQDKAYYSELKKVAGKNLVALKRIQRLESGLKDCKQVYLQIPENKRSLITPYVSSEDEEIEEKIKREYAYWKKESFTRRGVPRDLKYTTLKGERVRSKSEVILADRFKDAGIPYYYEGKYIFEDKDTHDFETWFPDFQVLNPRTGELFFWEHFGLMDDPDYCASCQFKLETYAKHGIFVGKNLIVTMESSKHPLNVAYIDTLIEEYLK